MKKLALLIAIALFASSTGALQARPGGGGGGMRGGGGGGGRAPQSRPAPSNPGRGFSMPNDVPSSARPQQRPQQPQQRPQQPQQRPNNGTANNGSRPNSGNGYNGNNGNRPNNGNGNGNGNNGNKINNGNNGNKINNGSNNNNGNRTNINNSGNRTNVNNNNVNINNNVNRNYNGSNAYGYRGAVIVNPVYAGPAWGWNHGAVWTPYPSYWGGGFWGAFAVGATTAAIMGSIAYQNTTYTSYQVQPSSPGATLLSNYGLQQVQCGPPNLVVIYGPNNGIICANPNGRVAAGNYAVNENNLTIQSQ
jgi:hypothetical protein